MSDSLSSAPSVEPVSTSDAKRHMRITWSDDDDTIEELITASRVIFENASRRALITQTRVLRLEEFPFGREIVLPRAPLQSVTSIQYYDTNDTLQTYSSSNYEVDIYSTPGKVRLISTATGWPSTYDKPNAVIVTYIAGYGSAASSVPKPIRQAIKLLAAFYYGNREAYLSGPGSGLMELPKGFEYLKGMYRSYW